MHMLAIVSYVGLTSLIQLLHHVKNRFVCLRALSVNVGTLRERSGAITEILEYRAVEIWCVRETQFRESMLELFEERQHSISFSLKLNWDSYIVSIAKILSKKIGYLIHSMKFLNFDAVLDLYKCIIEPCMEYSCHVTADAPNCCFNILHNLQNM